MLKKTTHTLIAAAAIAGAVATTASAESCLPVGGIAMGNFFDEGKDQPMTISANLVGWVDTAAGKILEMRETPTGFEVDMEHYFGRADGSYVYTQDTGILTAVPGKEGRFMLEFTYEIQPEKSRGAFKGYEGTFNSWGLGDMRDVADMKGLVLYEGEICK